MLAYLHEVRLSSGTHKNVVLFLCVLSPIFFGEGDSDEPPSANVAPPLNFSRISNVQELPPVLFTLMKSTEPFLDEYYLTDLERVIKETGFANVQTVLTDPRHRTVTATVPY